jgi:hypothetical protein
VLSLDSFGIRPNSAAKLTTTTQAPLSSLDVIEALKLGAGKNIFIQRDFFCPIHVLLLLAWPAPLLSFIYFLK